MWSGCWPKSAPRRKPPPHRVRSKPTSSRPWSPEARTAADLIRYALELRPHHTTPSVPVSPRQSPTTSLESGRRQVAKLANASHALSTEALGAAPSRLCPDRVDSRSVTRLKIASRACRTHSL
jgi:hypothetical protein